MIKVWYLKWDEECDEKTKGERISAFIMGYKDDKAFSKENYRSYEMDLGTHVLEDIFAILNSDNRPNRTYERSLCVGDLIEINNTLCAVEMLGFKPVTMA